jgi:hypothetical protein
LTRAAELSTASYFQSIFSADVSVLVELVWIPSILQKKVVAASLGGGLALVDAEDLTNNISNSFYSFLRNSISKTLGYR